MKIVEITPAPLKGNILIPPSKSLCHRAIIAAALAEGQSIISNVLLSKDILATMKGVQALGAEITQLADSLIIEGGLASQEQDVLIDCNESGSTLRFLIPLGLLSSNRITYTGIGNLPHRPLTPYFDIFKEQDIFYSSNILPIEIEGRLKPGLFQMSGSISSQFITGLMFVLPLLNADSTIIITSPLESKGYIDITIEALRCFGIHIENNHYEQFFIKGNQCYRPAQIAVEGDYSQAAFWLAAGALSGDITCAGLSQSSCQGDKAILKILENSGAKLSYNAGYVTSKHSKMHAFDADVSQCPDIAPVLAVVAALSHGTSKITGAARLRIKECDRLKAITSELNKLGAKILEGEDSLTIHGVEQLKGGEVDSWGDHRIAMALAIAAAKCKEPIRIYNSGVIEKSYPSFFEDFKMLGGNLNERNLG
ncbi:MAG: aroA [Clostridia bacterium]|jgi:3-phosphoshikimate 1-carboxyvinyltransferase|nr:aroA [Clostridia bacterium]